MSDKAAGEIVSKTEVTEGDAQEIVKLKRLLDEEKNGRKKDQTRLSELEDENRRLKSPPAPPAPPAPLAPGGKATLSSWLWD